MKRDESVSADEGTLSEAFDALDKVAKLATEMRELLAKKQLGGWSGVDQRRYDRMRTDAHDALNTAKRALATD
jgi:hypothetical protein